MSNTFKKLKKRPTTRQFPGLICPISWVILFSLKSSFDFLKVVLVDFSLENPFVVYLLLLLHQSDRLHGGVIVPLSTSGLNGTNVAGYFFADYMSVFG